MRKRSLLLGALLALAAMMLVAGSAGAAVFKVDKRADKAAANPKSGKCTTSKASKRQKNNKGKKKKPDCTLRAAIQAANATSGADKLVLKKKNYRLKIKGTGEDGAKKGDLDVTSKIEIGGRNASINGKGIDRIFDVSAKGDLTLKATKLFNGAPEDQASGGAIRSAGKLVLKRSSIGKSTVTGDGASGGGVFNDAGSLRVSDSEIVSSSAVRAGGGIEANGGDTTIEDSMISDNDAGPGPGNGGGFHLTGAGTVTVTDSLVASNSATAEGGGLWNSSGGTMTVDGVSLDKNIASGNDPDQGGGAIYNDGGTLSVIDSSSLTANQAIGTSGSGGALLNNGGALTVKGSTLADNKSNRAGGGIETVAGTVDLDRVDLLRNITGAAPGNGGGLHVTGAGIVNVTDGRAANNNASAEGGGLWNSTTGVMTVNGTTVANNTAGGNDQTQGGGGLYNDGGTVVVGNGTLVDGNVANGTSGSGGGVLTLGPLAVYDSTISANSAQRAGGGIETRGGRVDLIGSRLLTNATGANPGNGGGLHVSGTATVNVTNSLVRANTASSEGGGLWNSDTGTMTVDSSRVDGNTASGAASDQGGGGVFSDGGDLAIQNESVIDGNVADGAQGSGGGVLSLGDLTVDESTISSNTSLRAGGGIETTTGQADLTGARLTGNATNGNTAVAGSPGNGGGLHVTGAGTVNVTGGLVRGNKAAAEGGGLWNNTGTMTVDSTVIKNNTASGPASDNGGGGIYQLTGGTLVVQNGSSIVGNSADGTSGSGGGILNDQATVTVNSSELVNNDASRAGGGIENTVDATLTVNSVLFDGNSTGANPGNGGAIHNGVNGIANVDGSTFTNNAAANEGGGVWNDTLGTFVITDSSISNGTQNFANGNTARANGGPNAYQETGPFAFGTLTINGVIIPGGDPGV